MFDTVLPLVFLPAMGCDGQLWARQILDLSDVSRPELGDLTLDDTLEAMAARVLSDAPPRFAVAGVSLGGYVADAEGVFRLFDLNMKPNMTGPGRPGRGDQDCLSALAARAEASTYADLLLAMLAARF